MRGNKMLIPLLLCGFNFCIGQYDNFPLQLSLHKDLPIIGGNIALVGLNAFLGTHLAVPGPERIQLLDKKNLFYLDRMTFREFNHTTERRSHYMMLSTVALPVLLAPLCASGRDLMTMGVIGIETYMTTYVVIQSLKILARRPRPEMYSDTYNIFGYRGLQSLNSFPSRHVALAFSSAGFIHASIKIFFPEKKWYSVLKYSAYSAAFVSGFLRYHSGVHHLTDVLAGAAIGWTFGYLVPWIHQRKFDKKLSAISVNYCQPGVLSFKAVF